MFLVKNTQERPAATRSPAGWCNTAPSGWIVEPTTMVRPLDSPGLVGPSSEWSRGRSPGRDGRTPLAPGDRLGGYRLLERLGHGGQGDVWKAMRGAPESGLVALKVLRPSLARDPARMAQFRREAERGGRLEGPSLLQVYECGVESGYHFMAMCYVEGTSLRDVIRARAAHLAGRASEGSHRLIALDEPGYLRAMTGVLAGAAEALARVHAQRIAHRDVKPANILLDNGRPEGVYLCDFGLGRDLEIATPHQMRDGAGTPMYMAPERLLRTTADEVRCDIYSLGVTLFEALTLCRPFQVPEHVTLASLPAFLATSRPRRPCELRPDLPRDVEAVIVEAMDRDPARRPDSADRLAADLRRIEACWSPPGFRTLADRRHDSQARGPHSAPAVAAPALRGMT